MHSLFYRSLHLGYGCFGVDFWSLLRVTQKLYEQLIDKECINFVFSAIFRHVTLLVTKISCQDQNFRIIPRRCHLPSALSFPCCLDVALPDSLLESSSSELSEELLPLLPLLLLSDNDKDKNVTYLPHCRFPVV